MCVCVCVCVCTLCVCVCVCVCVCDIFFCLVFVYMSLSISLCCVDCSVCCVNCVTVLSLSGEVLSAVLHCHHSLRKCYQLWCPAEHITGFCVSVMCLCLFLSGACCVTTSCYNVHEIHQLLHRPSDTPAVTPSLRYTSCYTVPEIHQLQRCP